MKRKPLPQLLREVFLSNLNNKGMALILAVMIWAFAFNRTEDDAKLDLSVRVAPADPENAVVTGSRISASPDGRGLETPFQNQVTLYIKGQNRVLDGLIRDSAGQTRTLTVTRSEEIDLTDPEIYGFPKGVKIENANPLAIEVDVEDRIAAEKVVSVRLIGQAPPPHHRDRGRIIKQEPQRVTVVGPRSRVEDLERIDMVLDLGNYEGPRFVENLPLQLPGLGLAPDSPAWVKVTVGLEPHGVPAEYDVDIAFSAPGGYRMSTSGISTVKIKFFGPEEDLAAVAERIRAKELYGTVRVPLGGEKAEGVTEGFSITDVVFPPGTIPETVQAQETIPPALNYKLDLERNQ